MIVLDSNWLNLQVVRHCVSHQHGASNERTSSEVQKRFIEDDNLFVCCTTKISQPRSRGVSMTCAFLGQLYYFIEDKDASAT